MLLLLGLCDTVRVRMDPMVRDLLVMMMLLMKPVRRRLRRCSCHEKDRKQERGENGSHAISPSNSQWRYALACSSVPVRRHPVSSLVTTARKPLATARNGYEPPT